MKPYKEPDWEELYDEEFQGAQRTRHDPIAVPMPPVDIRRLHVLDRTNIFDDQSYHIHRLAQLGNKQIYHRRIGGR